MDELAQMMTAAWAPLDPYASLGFTRPVTPPLGVTGADPERTEEIEEEPPLPSVVTPEDPRRAREPELRLPELDP